MLKKYKNRGGRPKISQFRVQKLAEAFEDGLNVVESCLLAGISTSTYYNYCKQNQGFLDKMTHSQHTVLFQAKKNIAKRIENGDIKLSKWWIVKKDKSFSSNVNVEVNAVWEEETEDVEETENDIKVLEGKELIEAEYWKKKYEEIKAINDQDAEISYN